MNKTGAHQVPPEYERGPGSHHRRRRHEPVPCERRSRQHGCKARGSGDVGRRSCERSADVSHSGLHRVLAACLTRSRRLSRPKLPSSREASQGFRHVSPSCAWHTKILRQEHTHLCCLVDCRLSRIRHFSGHGLHEAQVQRRLILHHLRDASKQGLTGQDDARSSRALYHFRCGQHKQVLSFISQLPRQECGQHPPVGTEGRTKA